MAARFLIHSAASARFAAGIASRQSRTIASTAFLRHKESAVHHNLEDSTTQEKHKQDLLSKQKAGKGEWKRELASDSEEAVRAERDPASIEELQKRTKDEAEKPGKN
jgi:hypothetical protein